MKQQILNISRYSLWQNNTIVFTLVGLLLLFFLRDCLYINLPFFVFILYLTVAFIFFKRVDFLALGCVMPLFTHGLQTYLVLGIAMIVFFIRAKKIKLEKTLILLFVLLLYEALHYFLYKFDFGEYLRYVVIYLYIGIMVTENQDVSREKRIQICKVFSITYLFVMLIIYLQMYNLMGNNNLFSVRFGSLAKLRNEQYVGLYDNANMIALYSLLSLVICVKVIKNGGNKYVWCIILLLSATVGFLTQSKTFFICLGIYILIVAHKILSSKKTSISKKIFVLSGITFLSIFSYLLLFSNMISVVWGRFGATDDLFSDRGGVFTGYHRFLMNNPLVLLLGTGLQRFDVCGIANAPHNAIQETIVCFGIIGFFIVLGIVLSIVKQQKRKNGTQRTDYDLLIMYFAFIQSIQFFRLSSIALLLLLIMVSMTTERNLSINESYINS